MSGGCLSTIRCAVEDWYNYYIYFSTAALFISGLVLSHSFAEYAVVSTLIDYLTGNWEEPHLPKAVAIIKFQDGIATVLAVVLAYVADSCIGRVNMIVFTTISYVSGLVLLWWSTKFLGPIGEIVTFYVAAVMLAVGMSGREPPLKAFLADQLSKKENPNEEEPEQIEGRTNVWWRIARFSGATIALFCLPNASWEKAFWEKAFKVCALVMGANLLLFLFGYGITAYGLSFYGLPCYNIVKPSGSPLRIIHGVVKLAIHHWHWNYPRTENGFYSKNRTASQFEENHGQTHLSPKVLFLRWLDKAAIIDERTPSITPEEQEKCGHLCTVEQVREVKSLFSLIPIWITFFGCSLVGATGNTFFFEQTSNLDFDIGNNVHIPLNIFFALRSSVRFIISFLFWSKKATQQHVTRMRIGVGMVCSILCCIAAWQVEVHRLHLINEEMTDPSDPTPIISMSVLWLVPQFTLLGLMEGLASDGLHEFFYDHVATPMRSYGPSFSDCVLGFGNFIGMPFVLLCRSWFKNSINTSHLDRYYLTLAILSFVCLVMYAYASYSLKPFHIGNASEGVVLNRILVHSTDNLTESQPITSSASSPMRIRNVANAAAATGTGTDSLTESQPITSSISFPKRRRNVANAAAATGTGTDSFTESQPITSSVSSPMRRRNVANAAAATATESQPTKSFSFPFRSISLRLKDKKVGESAANLDSPEHMEEPLLQSPASTEAEEGLPPDDKPESLHD
ncbi:hypothetical protein SO802_029929 [Lithocarpus litseifolius]|uniref:Uncharacterized protein n=1 Tax=Lithocarpus litseifolius TaxID=425828 RepID=A0AAW2BUH4_9ROSI